MSIIPTQLQHVRELIDAGEVPGRENVRTLLRWFSAQRRGYYVLKSVREALATLHLATDPDFEFAFIDEPLTFIRTDAPELASVAVNGDKPSPPAEPITMDGPSSTDVMTVVGNDPAYRIGKLPAANKMPTSVQPTSTVEEAITLMLVHDYSQLPVMTRPSDVRGMITWASIGKALHFGRNVQTVSACMLAAQEIRSDTSLFAAIPIIVQHEYVLVRDRSRQVTGIVTTADLSLQFRILSEPFLLLGEAENHLRALIDRCFSREAIVAVRDPSASGRPIGSAADLTFGEYKRLLEDPSSWDMINLKLDRKRFIALLEEVRIIRNNVMHFDPDGIGENDLQVLRQFAGLVRELAQSGLI